MPRPRFDSEEKRQRVQAVLADTRPSGNGWLKAFCPFCLDVVGKPDRDRAFSINKHSGFFHCFRCGVAGRLDGFADEEMLLAPPSAAKTHMQPPEGFIALATSTAMCAQPARQYLAQRGVSPALVADVGIGCCVHGRYAGRVVVPVRDGETWHGWVARAWRKGADKPYLYPAGEWRGRALFNHAALFEDCRDPVFVVEGVFDALALWPDAVAVLGKPSHEQIAALLVSKRSLVVALDGDAWEEGQMLAMRLTLEGVCAGAVRLPPKKDPDEIPKADIWEAGRAALCCAGIVAV